MKITNLLLKFFFSLLIFCSALFIAEMTCLVNIKTFNYQFGKKIQNDLKVDESELSDIEKKIVNLPIPNTSISKFYNVSSNVNNSPIALNEINDTKQDIDGYKKSTVHLYFNDTKLKFTSFFKIVDFKYKRLVSFQEKKTGSDCFIVAAGDSFTYGYGVNQGSDYPSQLAKLSKQKCTIYNLGVNGESANDFYTRNSLDSNYLGKVKESSGDFIWVYINAQMQRLVLPSNAYATNKFFQEKSEFSLKNNELFYHGTFADKNTWLRKMIYLLSLSSIVKTFNLEIPKIHTEDHYELFFKLLDFGIEIASQNQRTFTGKYIVLYDKPFDIKAFENQAKKQGFIALPFYKILNFIKQRNANNIHLAIPFDGHPTSESYYLLANYLNQQIYVPQGN